MADAHDQTRRKSFLPNLPKAITRQDRRKSMHFKPDYNPRPRWMLHFQAVFWRALMGIGMFLHKFANPKPPKPNFSKSIPATISGQKGVIPLQFYVPKDWVTQKRLWEGKPEAQFAEEALMEEDEEEDGVAIKNKNRRVSTALSDFGQNLRRRSMNVRRWGGYPVVINFHGGGFTIGTSTDDARWCGTVVDECNAVVIAVDYRRAPEHPFPTAVEDGVDAVLWVHEHAAELGIDREKIALSGFSSGGNMAVTVPLRLYQHQNGFEESDDDESYPQAPARTPRPMPPPSDSSPSSSGSTQVPPGGGLVEHIDPNSPAPTLPSPSPKTTATATAKSKPVSEAKIRCIVPWYPSLDYTRTREERRATQVRKDHELPAIFTNLFDESYLHPPKSVNLDSPYLSPGVAPTSLLQHGLPQEIIMYCCEVDMLLDEGEAFRDRLRSPPLNKNVVYRMIEGEPHGWDKAPNPLKPTPGVREHYLRACRELRRVLGTQPGVKEHATAQGPSAAPRGSIQVVR
ncbi:hypothetical protein LTR86_002535 [Recurvomyces mirabilis]|nr:hypothetical protein LTR86_002535 [Recurvomyces mirabilis]